MSQTILHSKSKWRHNSSFTPHKQHKRLSTTTPHLSKLVLVAILFVSTLQAVTWAEGKALHLQNLSYKNLFSPSRSLLKTAYADFTECLKHPKSFHTQVSSISMSDFIPWSSCNKWLFKGFSHSKSLILQGTCHTQPTLTQSSNSTVLELREMLKEYNLGKTLFKAPQPTQLSSQKNDILPITNLPKESILKILSPPLQIPNLLQIIPPKRILPIFPLSRTSLTTIFRFKNLFPQTALVCS